MTTTRGERVYAELCAWRADIAAGNGVKHVTFFRKPLAKDEILYSAESSYAARPVPRDPELWDLRPNLIDRKVIGYRNLKVEQSPPGVLLATNRRLLVLATPKRIHAEFAWADVESAAVDPKFVALLIRLPGAEEAIAVLKKEMPKTVVHNPSDTLKAAATLLRAEGAFQASRGHFDEWFAGLPARLSMSDDE